MGVHFARALDPLPYSRLVLANDLTLGKSVLALFQYLGWAGKI